MTVLNQDAQENFGLLMVDDVMLRTVIKGEEEAAGMVVGKHTSPTKRPDYMNEHVTRIQTGK